MIEVVGTAMLKGVERVAAVTAPGERWEGWACAIGIVRVPEGDEVTSGVPSGSPRCATSAVIAMKATATPATSAPETAPPRR